MRLRTPLTYGLVLLFLGLGPAVADEPKPIPKTRPEMKEALDALKYRKPRLPLPPPTEEELEQARRAAAERAASGNPTGLRGGGVVNNGRMRQLYLPRDASARGVGSRNPDPAMKFDFRFSTELFWIVSRVNNCHYCLGHQEDKLRSAGATEDDLAALDLDWSLIPESKQAAYRFAAKVTARPDTITQADFDELRKHYSPNEAFEILFLVSRYNATNRWTDSLGIPQEEHRELKTETTPKFAGLQSKVALLDALSPDAAALRRPKWESPEVVRQKWKEARDRKPRFELADAPEEAIEGAPAKFARLVNHFPQTGVSQLRQWTSAQSQGRLSPKVKAQIAWTCARSDRAWYALDLARKMLEKVGVSEETALELAPDHPSLSDAERAVMRFAQKLTERPQHMTDDDIESLRKHYSDHETAEIVYHVTQAAFLNRVTEGAQLPLED